MGRQEHHCAEVSAGLARRKYIISFSSYFFFALVGVVLQMLFSFT